MCGYKVFWDGDGLDFDDTQIQLNILAYRTVGVDETREEYDPVRDELATTLCGLRAFTLSIRADSYDMGEPAYEILERIRRRLRGGAARVVLEETGLALTTLTNPIVDLDVVADNRPIYSSTWDVGMAFAVNEVDVQALGGGKVAAGVEATGTVTGSQNDPITVPIVAPPGVG